MITIGADIGQKRASSVAAGVRNRAEYGPTIYVGRLVWLQRGRRR